MSGREVIERQQKRQMKMLTPPINSEHTLKTYFPAKGVFFQNIPDQFVISIDVPKCKGTRDTVHTASNRLPPPLMDTWWVSSKERLTKSLPLYPQTFTLHMTCYVLHFARTSLAYRLLKTCHFQLSFTSCTVCFTVCAPCVRWTAS